MGTSNISVAELALNLEVEYFKRSYVMAAQKNVLIILGNGFSIDFDEDHWKN